MEKRALGGSGISVRPFCLGGNVFGWTADEAASFALLDAFVDAGFDFVDTADVYSSWLPAIAGGESETVIGNWLAARGRRDRVVIATKIGMWDRQPGLKAANIVAACEGSLKRLQHRPYRPLSGPSRRCRPRRRTKAWRHYPNLIAAGKVRAIGASNYDAPRLSEALKDIAREKDRAALRDIAAAL